ncbi:MAG: NAD-dependent epimerase/dehydratase family protein [Bacteroidales bacterium]|jgi:nucleoside-diphosphate-sugar epimerase
MRLLITGGAGCLGSNLIERYLPQDHEICVIDNFATGKREVVPEVNGLNLVEGSVSDMKLVFDVFEHFRPDIVIHSAASYKYPTAWGEDTSTNVLGSIHIAKAAEKFKVQKIINFQTALCYGRPAKVPIPIDHPTAPFTSYGISKTAGEAYLMKSGLPVISLRLANICAPRLAIGPIPTFYKRLKAGQNCFCSDTIRDFLDIHDFYSLMDRILFASDQLGIYNVSTGVGNSILDVLNTVAEYLKMNVSEVPIVPPGADDVPKVVLDPSATERVFNWKADIDFKKTIINQLEWYDKYGVNDIFSHLAGSK